MTLMVKILKRVKTEAKQNQCRKGSFKDMCFVFLANWKSFLPILSRGLLARGAISVYFTFLIYAVKTLEEEMSKPDAFLQLFT